MITYENKRVASLFKPAAEIGFEEDNTIAEAFWNYGSGPNWTSGGKYVGQPTISITSEFWSWPIYDAKEANTKIRIWRNPALWDETARWETVPEFKEPWGGPFSRKPCVIPFNTSWKTGKGTDQGIIIKDVDSYYAILNLRPMNFIDNLGIISKTFTWWPWGSAQTSNSDYVCDGLGPSTAKNAGEVEGCGSGKIPKQVGILTADMLEKGVDQALSMVVANCMMGPGATFRYPGTRVEFSSQSDISLRAVHHKSSTYMPVGYDPRMVPCGSRIVVNRTEAWVRDWALLKPEAQRLAAYNAAMGLVNFGFVTKETGEGTVQIECEGTLNPTAAKKFEKLGLKTSSDFTHLLDGLITGPQDLRVVKEPK